MIAALVLSAAVANPNRFEVTAPGGESRCVLGTDWSFMHRRGTLNKIVFEFQGGGGCWSAATCKGTNFGICTNAVDVNLVLSNLNGDDGGMHDGNNDANPFKEWFHVYIPYCTCDMHTGIKDTQYQGVTAHHRGHINFMIALNWTLQNFPANPDAITISGSSAGSVGAQLSWPFFVDAYPNASASVWGDSFMGVLSEAQYTEAYTNWGLTFDDKSIPGLAPEFTSKWRPRLMCYLSGIMLAAMPDTQIALYTSNSDMIQTEFYEYGGGLASDWTSLMRGEVGCMLSNTTQIHTFIAGGSDHVASETNVFFSRRADGVSLVNWVGQVITGQTAQRAVDCLADSDCSGVPPPPGGGGGGGSNHLVVILVVVAAVVVVSGVAVAMVMVRRKNHEARLSINEQSPFVTGPTRSPASPGTP
eukprot:Hpha_TRINITY_DN5871_c0_g1::TRINITY_DN5871_c0_g1_i1::g.45627::m.45627